MTSRVKVEVFVLVLLLAIGAQPPQPPNPAFDHINHQFADALVPNAEAQSPPIPTQTAVTGVANIITLTSSSLLSAPSSTTQPNVRNYVYQLKCVNFSGGAAVLTVYDSPTTGAAPSIKAYVNCPASAAQGGDLVFNPPLRLSPNGALTAAAVTTTNITNNIFVYASGFTSR